MTRRLGACVIALGVVVAACGGSTKLATSPTTSSSVVTTTSVAATTTSAPVDYGKIYLRLVAPANAALDTLNAAAGKLGNDPAAAAVQQITTPFAAATVVLDNKLLRVHWPPAVSGDIKALVRADGAYIGDLNSASSQTAFSAASWESALTHDGSNAATAANIVRADLGLPPP